MDRGKRCPSHNTHPDTSQRSSNPSTDLHSRHQPRTPRSIRRCQVGFFLLLIKMHEKRGNFMQFLPGVDRPTLAGVPDSEAGPLIGFFLSFLSNIHEKRGNFCNFRLKIAEKEGENRPRRSHTRRSRARSQCPNPQQGPAHFSLFFSDFQ